MPGPTGVLDQLTPEQQAMIIAWLDEGLSNQTVVDRIAAAPPEGFGMRTHITSLRRFYARKQLADRVVDLELAREHAACKGAEDTFLTAAENLLAEKAFAFLTGPDFKSADFSTVAAWVAKSRQIQLRREALRLASARLAILQKNSRFQAALQEARARTPYEEEKIKTARTELQDELKP